MSETDMQKKNNKVEIHDGNGNLYKKGVVPTPRFEPGIC